MLSINFYNFKHSWALGNSNFPPKEHGPIDRYTEHLVILSIFRFVLAGCSQFPLEIFINFWSREILISLKRSAVRLTRVSSYVIYSIWVTHRNRTKSLFLTINPSWVNLAFSRIAALEMFETTNYVYRTSRICFSGICSLVRSDYRTFTDYWTDLFETIAH